MPQRIRVESFTISLDGYGAGPDQSVAAPMGLGGEWLHGWARGTRTFRAMFGQPGGSRGLDDAFAREGFRGIGAWILGRNMFTPHRGPWADDGWRGWWGEEPPYHCDVFVLTHHARPSLAMKGGTVFHFVTGGAAEARERALAAARGADVRLGGGVATVREFLRAGWIDRMHLALSPVLLGRGEHLLHGIDLAALGYRVVRHAATRAATHVVMERQ